MNNNVTDIITEKNSARKLSAVLLSVFVVIFSALTFVSMRFAIVFALAPLFIGAVACLSCVFYFYRNPLAVALPFLPFAVNLSAPVSTLGCGWLILICSLVIFLCMRGKLETFPTLICGATVYALAAGAAFIAFIVYVFGTVENAVAVFGELYNVIISATFAELGAEMVAMYIQMYDQIVMSLPAVFVAFGLLAMWLTKCFIGFIAQTVTGEKNVFGKSSHAPKGLALVYLLISMAAIFFTFSDAETYFAMNNVQSVLQFVFMFEGISAFLFERNPAMSRGKFIGIIVATSISMLIIPSFAVIIIAYYGVLRTFGRKKAETLKR